MTRFAPIVVLVMTANLVACTTDAGSGRVSTNSSVIFDTGRIADALRRAPLTERDVANGLTEALQVAVRLSTQQASRENGYYANPKIRIPLPPSFERAAEVLRNAGFGRPVDNFEQSMNRAAEHAALEAKPILLDAVRNLSFSDAWEILHGDDTAATDYLRRQTQDQIYDAFRPIVAESLDVVGSTRIYNRLAATYNDLPLTHDIQLDLTEYTTGKATDGLFVLMANEERKIREDPLARTTELLRRVFEAQD